MKQPLQIQFRGMQVSPALEAAAREKASKLDQFTPNLMSCRVVIELEQKHQQQGRPYGVSIDLTMPGQELRVDKVDNEDVYVALRDAFDAMTRRLEDTVRRARPF
jgi:ribosomal subunit interface protein